MKEYTITFQAADGRQLECRASGRNEYQAERSAFRRLYRSDDIRREDGWRVLHTLEYQGWAVQ